MRNSIIRKITPTTRLICLFILSISMFIAKSLFLILFITTLTVLLALDSGKKVNEYVNKLKKLSVLLLFLIITYIIIYKYSIFNLLVFIYKLIIITFLFIIFGFSASFYQLHQAIYNFLKPLQKIKINVEEISFDIVMAFVFLKNLIDNKQKIGELQKFYCKRKINIKNYILPIFINSANELNEYQYHLKTKFYKLSYRKSNAISMFVLILFLILFTLVMFKEVIL